MMEERDLIRKVKQGDKTAFSLLYTTRWSRVYGFVCLYISSASDAEEIVQEVFVRLWEKRSCLDPDKNLEGLLFILTRNLIFNEFRSSFQESVFVDTVTTAWEIEDASVSGELETKDLREYIQTLVEMLPPRQQEVFNMSRNAGMSYKEIAAELGITPKTVERHINEVLKQLRKKLNSTL